MGVGCRFRRKFAMSRPELPREAWELASRSSFANSAIASELRFWGLWGILGVSGSVFGPSPRLKQYKTLCPLGDCSAGSY